MRIHRIRYYKLNTMFRIIAIITLVFSCFLSNAQEEKKVYNRQNFIKDSTYIVRVKLIRPQVRADNRNIFFKNQMLALAGFDAGVLLKDKLRVTLGYYKLNENLSDYNVEQTKDAQYERQFKMNYGALNTEFIYMNKRFFSLGMPLEFGFGQNVIQYKTDPLNTNFEKKSGFVLATDFGLSGTFKPIRWIGIRGVVGYHKNVINQIPGFRFDGVFTSVGLNVDIREISKDIQMYRLKKKYKRLGDPVGTAVDLITD